MPQRGHEGYGELSRELRRTVRTLSVFLRLAETLDRSRNGVVRKVAAREHAGVVRLDVFAVGDAELEVWAANRQLPLLEAVLKRSAKIVAHHLRDPNDTAAPAKRGRKAAPRDATPARRVGDAVARPVVH